MPLSRRDLLHARLSSLHLPNGWCTYILICVNGSYYVGSTENLLQRILDHAAGKGASYTKETHPAVFAWYEPHPDESGAKRREGQLKGWSREKKNAFLRAGMPQGLFGVAPHLHLRQLRSCLDRELP